MLIDNHTWRQWNSLGRVPTSFWWYLMASLSLARSWHCLGSSSSLWSLSLWFRMVSSSLELLAWSRRSLANRLHCWDSSSYSWRNSFSTWEREDVIGQSSEPQMFTVEWPPRSCSGELLVKSKKHTVNPRCTVPNNSTSEGSPGGKSVAYKRMLNPQRT